MLPREEVLKPYVCLTTPSRDIVAKTAAKDALFRTAREKGIAVPETYIPKSLDDVKAIASSILYPCLHQTHSLEFLAPAVGAENVERNLRRKREIDSRQNTGSAD